jgi:hypothetical protein
MLKLLVILILSVLALNAFSSPIEIRPDGEGQTVELPGSIR